MYYIMHTFCIERAICSHAQLCNIESKCDLTAHFIGNLRRTVLEFKCNVATNQRKGLCNIVHVKQINEEWID